jgi:hypothetical protein
MLKRAEELGYDYIATGHYAKIEKGKKQAGISLSVRLTEKRIRLMCCIILPNISLQERYSAVEYRQAGK